MVDYRLNRNTGESRTKDSKWVWRSLAVVGAVASLYGLYEVSQGLTKTRGLDRVLVESFRAP